MRIALKVAILSAGLTQRQVSLAAEIAETRLSAIVRGRDTPTDVERARLAAVLRCPEGDLFTERAAATSTLAEAV